MDFTGIPLFAVMKNKLSYHSERQAVLAQNIANADTPGYQARDIAAPDFKSMAFPATQKITMRQTDSQHFGASVSGVSIFKAEKRPKTYERTPTGNNVVIEEEMAKVGMNQSEYQKTLSLYRKSMELFKIAIGKSSGGG
jgi:flagellar basal-body rod protein FlgB